jgi:predicted transcriptional regulator
MAPQTIQDPRDRQPPADAATRRPEGRITLPDGIVSPEAKLVYLYLLVRGTATVDELGAALGLPKLALFSILATLDGSDLIVRDGDAVSTA